MDSVQILVAGLLIIALLNTAFLVWAFYSSKNKKAPKPPLPSLAASDAPKSTTPQIDLTHVEHTAEQQLQEAVEASKQRLQQSINTSVDKVAAHVGQVAETTVGQEFEKYKVILESLQAQSVQEFSKLQQQLSAKQQELLANLETEVAAEREKRVDTFNAHLNDVVSSYIAESLGDNVDLGAQSTYIIQMLEQHKEDIKRDVLG